MGLGFRVGGGLVDDSDWLITPLMDPPAQPYAGYPSSHLQPYHRVDPEPYTQNHVMYQ